MTNATSSSPYFYMAGDQRRGPFTFDELLQQPVHCQIPVWCKGMTDWQPAGDLPALAGLFPPVPPGGKRVAVLLQDANDLKRHAEALYRLNFGIPVLVLATFVLSALTGNAYDIAYVLVAAVWAVLLWHASVAARAKRPWLWAAAGVLPVVSYVPLIILHGRLKRPLVTAGYRVGFFGRATPPTGAGV